MAIYQLFEEEKKQQFTETFEKIDAHGERKGKNPLFSTLVTRFCFLLLLVADCFWFIYNVVFLLIISFALLLCGGKSLRIKKLVKKFFLGFRRSVICGLSLLVGLFSPPFGIMVGCTYFLMYDKAGMEEVVPAALQSQFKDIFRSDS